MDLYRRCGSWTVEDLTADVIQIPHLKRLCRIIVAANLKKQKGLSRQYLKNASILPVTGALVTSGGCVATPEFLSKVFRQIDLLEGKETQLQNALDILNS